MREKLILSLCDLTGNMVQPWVDAGYQAVLIDPQHAVHGWDEKWNIGRYKGIINDFIVEIRMLIRENRIAFVAGFPPCTDVAVSGARWWEEKRKSDPYFQAKAALVAEQCRLIGELSGAPWMFENPVSAFSNIFGRPNHTFHPWEFTGFCSKDNYTKKTCLWTGNGFKMPEMNLDPTLGTPDDRIHKAAPGPDRENFRSATPLGFARAVFQANAPHFKDKE
jgi:hypothetical protein